MRVSTNFALPLSAVLFGLLLVARPALAGTANCPPEPASNVPIADGEVIIGTNCTLTTPGDTDSFVFNANNGDTYQLAAAINGAPPGNLCMTLRDPSLTPIYSGCSSINFPNYQNSVVTDQTLTVTGRYTIDITEPNTATINYAVSLERLYPFPPNAQQVTLGKVVAGDIAEITDSNAFTFELATTGVYQVSATLNGTITSNLCMAVYQPGGGASVFAGCTSIGFPNYQNTVKVLNYLPPEDGTYMAFFYVAGNDGTATYTMEVSCLAGKCPVKYPPCTLTDTPTYDANSSTLTMNFTVGNKYPAATWNAWLTYQNTLVPVFSMSQAITPKGSPMPSPQTYPNLSPEGDVGVLSTLTTLTEGIVCSSWEKVETP